MWYRSSGRRCSRRAWMASQMRPFRRTNQPPAPREPVQLDAGLGGDLGTHLPPRSGTACGHQHGPWCWWPRCWGGRQMSQRLRCTNGGPQPAQAPGVTGVGDGQGDQDEGVDDVVVDDRVGRHGLTGRGELGQRPLGRPHQQHHHGAADGRDPQPDPQDQGDTDAQQAEHEQPVRPRSPAHAWKVDLEGPTATRLRNPLVGEPPLIQALAAGVA